jgi:hypothetical protein
MVTEMRARKVHLVEERMETQQLATGARPSRPGHSDAQPICPLLIDTPQRSGGMGAGMGPSANPLGREMCKKGLSMEGTGREERGYGAGERAEGRAG